MLKVVENIQESTLEEEIEDTTHLTLDNQFLKDTKSGTQLILRNFDGSNQFMIELMNNAKLKKGQHEPDPFRRSIYARGYQGFLTHDKNWVTFDMASFAM